MRLEDLGNIPFGLSVLEGIYSDVGFVASKAKRLEDRGDIIRLKRGAYVVSPSVNGRRLNEFLIANHLYGPSYVSMQSALRYHGLIPEAVHEVISMTVGLAKNFSNSLGTFRYVHCGVAYYHIGVTRIEHGDESFMMAGPEKALCDLMLFTPHLNLRYLSEMRAYLEDDMRIDMDGLSKFDLSILRECADTGKKKNMIRLLIKFIENGRDI
ncbi:MAG: hypothetical protein K2K49_02700 [Duncaniella sp.]|nr:hypothetical protein [Duncaniella sp.]